MIASARTCSIIVEGVLLGCIAPIVGEAERWIAWSIHRTSAAEANESRFQNMHAAIDWLREENESRVVQQRELA